MQYPAMLDQNIHLSPRQPYSLAIGQYLVSFIGRSFRISCEVKGRIGASIILSRRLCGSGAMMMILFGQSRFQISDNEGVAMPAQAITRTVMQHLHHHLITLQLRGGSAVDASRPLFDCRGKKEM